MIFKIFWTGFTALFVIAGIAILIYGLHDLDAARQSESWEQTKGIIVFSEVSRSRSRDSGTTYRADILYDYHVNETLRSGDRIKFGELSTRHQSDAKKVLRNYPKGKEVIVYYNSDNPDESVLIPGVHSSTWFLPVFGLLFTVVGTGFMLIGIFVPTRIFRISQFKILRESSIIN